MRIELKRTLPCDPMTAYALVSDARLMNRWSTAEVVPRSPGDGGHPAGVGALRDVRVPGLASQTLNEVVLVTEPGERFAYTVIGGAPIKHHRGEVHLQAEGSKTLLEWTVDIEFGVPMGDLVAKRTLVPELNKSLDRMVRVAPSVRVSEPPPVRKLNESKATMKKLYRQAETIALELRELSETAKEHPSRWFTLIYAYVTDEIVRVCREGAIEHPAWGLELVKRFYDLYMRSVSATLEGREPERHWASAFEAMQRAHQRFKSPMARAGYIVAKGIQAHVEEDLPRSFASVYVDRYAGRCDYVRFLGDWWLLLPAVQAAGDRFLEDHSPKSSWPVHLRVMDRLVPHSVRDNYIEKNHYALKRERKKAFDRGERLAEMMLVR